MFNRFEGYGRLASCKKCGRIKPEDQTCVPCAEAFMRLNLRVQDTIDQANYEWENNIPDLEGLN